jgi:hypothetical protein
LEEEFKELPLGHWFWKKPIGSKIPGPAVVIRNNPVGMNKYQPVGVNHFLGYGKAETRAAFFSRGKKRLKKFGKAFRWDHGSRERLGEEFWAKKRQEWDLTL